MSLKELLDRFTLVSGLSMQETSRYLPIIEDCRAYFEERMRGELTESEKRRLTHACAVYAFYKISRIMQSEDFTSFKVGDVQFDLLSVRQNAESLWHEERENIRDIIDLNGGVAFRRVRV